MRENYTDNESVTVWIEDDILFHVYKKSTIDIHVAQESVHTKMAVCGNNKYLTFIDIREVKSGSKEAREFLSSEQGIANISAAAILAPTLLSKIIATFFLTFNSPNVKVKLFTDEKDALAWLKSTVPQKV